MRFRAAVIVGILLAVQIVPARAAAAPGTGAPGEGFSSNIRALISADAQYPAQSTQNPENAFLQLPRYTGQIDLRPDLFYDAEYANVMFKPRFTSSYLRWEDGVMKGGEDSLTRVFVNEWRVQAKPRTSLYLSFGKEKLLWGPSFLASPSNLLFRDTERLNPKSEVEGKYFTRAMYLPDPSLTITALAETQNDGSLPAGNDRPMRALKADWVGKSASASVIGYVRRNDRFRLGSYGQWTASDALLLYYDGIVSRGNDVLYPVEDPASPLGGEFVRTQDGSNRLFPTVTAGGAYTFLGGSTASIEFLYNSQGYGDVEASRYYALRQNASARIVDGGAMTLLSRGALAQALDTSQSFLRRYYLMGQYQVREIKNVLDVTVRYMHGIEERAGQASSIVEWRMSDRMTLFNINAFAVGGSNTEFSSVFRGSSIVGAELHF